MSKHSSRFGEFASSLILIVLLGLLILPMLVRKDIDRPASCQNHLKQFGFVFVMYANESLDHRVPPLSPVLDNWLMDMKSVYPEYVSDPGIFVCPDGRRVNPGAFELKRKVTHPSEYDAVGNLHPDCIWSLFYLYTGYVIETDEQALALYNQYRTDPEHVIRGEAGEIIKCCKDYRAEQSSAEIKAMPLMWDRVFVEELSYYHTPPGANVLYADGHVEFVRYTRDSPLNRFPVTRVSAETFGSVGPRHDLDCM